MYCETCRKIWQPIRRIKSEDDPHSSTTDFYLNIEGLGWYFYITFALFLSLAIIISKTSADIDYDNTPLMEWFGYNNICVYIDYPPVNKFSASLWILVMLWGLAYSISRTIRAAQEHSITQKF